MKSRYGLFFILAVYVLVRAFWLLADDGGRLMGTALAQALLKTALWIPSCALILTLLHRASPQSIWRELGLDRGLWAGVTFGVLVAFPLAATIAIAGWRFTGAQDLVAAVVFDPIAESILFSGFLFSQLRWLKWPLAPALLVSAFLFGLAHLDGQEFLLLGNLYRIALGLGDTFFWMALRWFVLGVIAVGAGGLLFTWLFHRWGTLWPTIALHAAINFWWTLSADRPVNDTSASSLVTVTGVGHGASMATAIIVTLILTRRKPYDFTRTV